MQKYIQPKKKKALVIRGKVSETGKSILQKIAFALVQEEEFVFNEIQVNILILADLTTIFDYYFVCNPFKLGPAHQPQHTILFNGQLTFIYIFTELGKHTRSYFI